MTEQVLRLFISSPGDVTEERRRVDLVVELLNNEFAGRVRIEAIRWETSYYTADATFQKQIPEAAECDVVVAVFRARLGTPLPEGFPKRPSGEPYPSGTAYEVLSAIEVRKAGKTLPDVYVFRYPNPPSLTLDSPDEAEVRSQWERLKGFFDAWFRTRSGEFIAAFQTYVSTDDFARQLEDCLRQWLERRGFVAQGPVWDRVLHGSPFPGLAAFEADREAVFFGRGLAIAQAIARLREAGAADAGGKRAPFLLLIGASGSGKSSLLRAGLLPRLTLPGTIPEIDLWRTAIVTPGPDPFLALAEGLFANAALGRELRQGTFRTKELFAKQLAGDPDIALAPLRDALDLAAQRRQSEAHFEAPRPARLALAIDQAERLFVEADTKTATAFAELLAALVRQNLAYLVFALRSDAYARFQSIEALVGLREAGATFDLVPPTAAELEEIVSRPVAACHPRLAFEQKDGRSLAALLVADARGGDALPLLQMTLSRLDAAETRRGDGLLRFADYQGMDAAVTETANEALDMLGEQARGELPALVAGLVTDVSADPLSGAPVPVVAALDRQAFEAQKPARKALIEAFVAKRLLTAEGDGVLARVRPVHEALLRIWPQAVAIVAETASLIRVRHTLEPMLREWLNAGESAKPGYLEISPALLAGAQQVLVRFGDDLPAPMREFIAQAAAADAARRDRERQEQEQRIRDAQALAAANRRTAQRTGLGLAAALLLVAVAGWQWWVARTQTQVALTQTQVAQKQTEVAQTQTELAETQKQLAQQAARDADAQRDQAVQAGSRALSALADQRVDSGDVATGALLALEATGEHSLPEVKAALVNARLHLREFAVLPQRNQVHAAIFSPNGRLVLTLAGGEARLWDVATGKNSTVITGHSAAINDARFNRDGTRVLTVADDSTARLYDAATGRTLFVLKGHTNQVTSVAFSPSGLQAVTSSRDHTARIWDLTSGQTTLVLAGHKDDVLSVAFDPAGARVLTTSKDGTARIWDAKTGTMLAELAGHHADVWKGTFSDDGKRVLTASLDTTAALWDSATGKALMWFKGHADRVFTALFIPGTNAIVTASYDQTARIWDIDTGATLEVLAGHRGAVMTARPSADGRYIVTASTDRTARIWDVATGKEIDTLAGHTNWVLDAAFSPDSKQIATAGRDDTARLWRDNATLISTGLSSSSRIWRAAIAPDGGLVAAPSDHNTARVWDAHTTSEVAILRGHTAPINGVVFDPSGKRVVTMAADNTARVWEARTGKQLLVLSGHTDIVISAAFSADGKRIVTGAYDKTARVWDADTGSLLLVLTGHEGAVGTVAFSPSSKEIMTVSPIDGTIRLWDAQTGKPAEKAIVKRGDVWTAAYSPDGSRIVATYIDVTIFDAATGDSLATYSGFGERVLSASYSPDGQYLLLASLDGTARIWDAKTGRPISMLSGFDGGVWTVAMSSDGRSLLMSSGPDSVRIWHMALDQDALIADLRTVLPRCLAPSEQAYFNLPAPPPEWCFSAGKWPYNSQMALQLASLGAVASA